MLGTLDALKRKEEIINRMNLRLSGKVIDREAPFKIEEELYESDEEHEIESQFENNTFYYFESDLLSKSFELATEVKDSYTIYFCIYQIDMDKTLPFLRYILKKEDEKYNFPYINFSYSQTDDLEIYFKNEVIKNMMSIVNLYDKIDGNFVNKVYKGFIEEDDKIFVFID